MTMLRVIGSAPEGGALVLASDDGERFTLPVTDELRNALRNAPAAQEHSQALSMSPREIQRRIRAGLTAAELAELTGLDLDTLARYEAPVLAERSYIAELARSTRVGREAGSPMLGELVTDRLASRGVTLDRVRWDAWRAAQGPWHVGVEYPVDGRSTQAVWTFDHGARTVEAQDDESRWLTETELLDVPMARRHLSPVPVGAPAAAPSPTATVTPLHGSPEPEPSTEELLDGLASKRGTREPVESPLAEDEEFEGFGPAQAREAGRSRAASGGRRGGRKSGRASVPSWDEIVFGATSE